MAATKTLLLIALTVSDDDPAILTFNIKATASALFATPQHPYTQGLLKSVPRLDGGGERELYSIPGLPPMLDQLSRGCPFAARCDRVMDVCRTDHPGNRSTETHEVHCHAFEGGAA